MRAWFPPPVALSALALAAACTQRVEIDGETPRADPTQAWLRLLESALQDGKVDYDRIDADRGTLHRYLRWVGEHGPVSDGISESKEDRRIAFMANAYNAAVIEGVLRARPIDSVQQVGGWPWSLRPGSGFFYGQKFKVDGSWTTLHVLEQQDLLARYQEPLVHVTLNCASRGCPPLRAWQADDIVGQMRDAMGAWLDSGALVCEGDRCAVSELFSWYEDDFLYWSDAPSLCAYLADFASGANGQWLADHADNCDLDFIPYDWGLNAAGP